MKKLLVLSVLLGLLALPMFASDITFGGDVTFGILSDFGDALGFSKDFTLDIMADIDDYNSLTANIDGLEGQVTGATAAPLNESKILVTTDVGMLFGLPIGLHVNWGYDDPDMNEFQNISGYGNEDPWDFSSPVSGEYWGLEFLVSVSFIEVELAFDPAGSSGGGDLLVGLAAKEPIPGLNAEIYYYQNEKGGSEFAKGRIGFDAAYGGEFGGFAVDAGAYFGFDLDDTAANAWALGVGLSGAYSIATVTVGIDGNETDALNTLSATLEADLVADMLGLYGGLWYDVANSELAEVDLGAMVHLGAVAMYLGYLIDGDSPAAASGDNFKAPPGIGDNGAYIKFDVDY
jgi:tetrahydromethanopterin S-methyltransferase subunit G